MSIQTWTFPAMGGTIPGIPGEWHIGQEVDIDTETNTVLAVRTRGISDSSVVGEVSPPTQQSSARKKNATLPVKQQEEAGQEGSV